jgi:hypothetical protein
MPTLINTTYYNLVNNILLNPTHINVYLDYLIKSYFNNTGFTFNRKNLMLRIQLITAENNGILPYFGDDTGLTFNSYRFSCDIGTTNTLYDLVYYVDYLLWYNFINKAEYRTLKRVLLANAYKVRDLVAEKIKTTYIDNYLLPPISRKIAINKIRRNAIYNLGLGLKLAVREYSKDF